MNANQPPRPVRGKARAGAEGVAVVGVEPGSPAAEHGFKTGDVILQVGGKSVESVKDVRSALDQAHASGKRDVLMRVKTADGPRFVALPLAQG